MISRLAALALLGGLLTLNAGQAQNRVPGANVPAQPVGKVERTLYMVRNADAAALAEAVGKLFKGEAEILAAPAGSGNAILISGSPKTVAEVVQFLEQLDRKPRTVEVEVVLVDVPVKKDADGKDIEPDLTGNVAAKLEALAKTGPGTVQRIKLTAVEGQPVTSTTGANKPVVSGAVLGGGGRGGAGAAGGVGGPGGGAGGFGGGPAMQRSVTYHQVGTTVRMTARVSTDDVIAVDLNVQDSKVRQPEAGEDAVAASFDNATLATKLNVPVGRTVAAQTVRTGGGKAAGTIAVVFVTARVVESGLKSQ